METLLDALTSAAAAATVGAIASAIAAYALSIRAAKAAQKVTAETKLVRALKADDFDSLGEFLAADLGSVGLGTYLRDSTTRGQFRVALGRVEDYLAPESGRSSFWLSGMSETSSDQSEDSLPQFHAEISAAISRGAYWNALASLRRALERQLRETSPSDASRSLGSLVRTAVKSGDLDAETGRMIEMFVPIANRAIHGEDVEAEAALQAIDLGLTALSRLGD